MNILYLCDEYPPGQHGGIGTSVRLTARQMVRMGHTVFVAGLYNSGYGFDDEFDDEGVKVYRFRKGFDSKWLKNEQLLGVRMTNRLLKDTGLMDWNIKRSMAFYKQKLEKIIADYKIDIIEMPDYNDYIRFCRSFIPFPVLSVPVVVKMNGSMTYFAREASKQVPDYVFKMEQTILNQAIGVASASKYTAVKSAAYFSYDKDITVLYNGISTNIRVENKFKNSKQVIFTGTLAEKKGIYQLAKAWNLVNKQMPDAQLLVLGKGSQKKVISCLTNEAKKTVSFKGHVDTGELYNYLAGSSISIFPSYSEAFALAPLEAMTFGTAVINSNRTSGPELIEDQIDGLLIDPDNIDQIASSILYLLNNPEVCGRLAKKGNEKVKEGFEISKIAAQNIQFYNKVLGGL